MGVPYGVPQPQQPMQLQPPGYNLSNIYAPTTSAPAPFSPQDLSTQLPNVQYSPQNSGLQQMMNSFLMGQGPLGSPQGSPQGQSQGGGLNNMMSFLGNVFGSGGPASGVGDALSSAGGSIASLFGL